MSQVVERVLLCAPQALLAKTVINLQIALTELCEDGTVEQKTVELEQGVAYRFDFSNSVDKNVIKKPIENCLSADQINDYSILFFESKKILQQIKLAVFDMDSTLIEAEVIDELAAFADVQSEVQAITQRAMQGEIEFNQSFEERVALLKGIDESAMQSIVERLPIMPGAIRLFETLRELGIQTAIISGGFDFFAEYLKQTLQADYVFANQLEVENKTLTGKHLGEIVDGERKAQVLQALMDEHLSAGQTSLAVGDGANDQQMLHLAKTGIAFHAKPKLKEVTQHHLDDVSLDALLCLLN